MTRHFAPPSDFLLPSQSTKAAADLFIQMMRCWRAARDHGEPVQPCLFRLLSPHGYGMLAPVLDSVMTLWEAALGRPVRPGLPGVRSDDERALVDMLGGERSFPPTDKGARKMASLFDGALRSARIMMGHAMPDGDAVFLPVVGTA